MAQTADELLKQLNEGLPNEANLTTDELQQRLGQYQTLSGLDKPKLNNEFLTDEIRKRLVQFGGDPTLAETLAGAIAQNGGQLPQGLLDPSFIGKNENLINAGLTPGFSNQALLPAYQIINSNLNQGRFSNKPDYTGDISRVQDLLKTSQEKSLADQQATDFTNSMKGTLEQNTNDYLAGATQRATDQFNQEMVPDLLQTANARGALYSGDVGDYLATGAAGLQSNLQNAEMQFRQQDQQFYQDAAYQDALRKSLQGNNDYQNFLGNERNRVLNQQQQGFQAGQNQLNASFQNQLYANQAQRKYQSDIATMQRQQDQYQRQQRSGLAGGLGQAIGIGTGAALGGSLGSYVGGQTGQGLGQSLPVRG